MYFNMYVTWSVFFGCGVIELSKAQTEELKRIYESKLSKKLQIGKKFPRLLLYTRKLALGIRLISPDTFLATAVVKQYIGNLRAQNNMSTMIIAIEEIMAVHCGYSKYPIQITANERYWEKRWIDLVASYLQRRNISIVNTKYEIISKNQTIIDYVRSYIAPMKDWKAIMNRINIVRLAKRLYLPFKLVGVDGGQMTNAYGNDTEVSSVD